MKRTVYTLETIIFMQGDEAVEVIDSMLYVNGWASMERIETTRDHLAQWDYGERTGETFEHTPNLYNSFDDGEYLLEWDSPMSWIGLSAIIDRKEVEA